ANYRPFMLVHDDPTFNASIITDPEVDKTAFAINVHRGLFDRGATDGELLAIIMHELEHAVGLHGLSGVKDRIARYYLAAGNREPFGFEQVSDPGVEDAVGAWMSLSEDAGWFSGTAMVGFPFPGYSFGGNLGDLYWRALDVYADTTDEACASAVAQFNEAYDGYMLRYDGNSQNIYFGEDTDLAAYIGTLALNAVHSSCFANFELDYFDMMALYLNSSAAEVRADMDAESIAVVEGKNAFEGISALLGHRRAVMREIEAATAEATGQPWSRVRVYSYEEAADDATVAVMHDMGYGADQGSSAMFLLVGEPYQASCSTLLGGTGILPYGTLADAHHAACWRVRHLADVADSGKLHLDNTDTETQRLVVQRPISKNLMASIEVPEPLPFPKRPQLIMH
ncbi:MAG: hypothetical protein KJO07_05400, partial [Deltaproteobacteria bacterium]|nr:hypothetical protein [Deltaproteobacteria bacterium]